MVFMERGYDIYLGGVCEMYFCFASGVVCSTLSGYDVVSFRCTVYDMQRKLMGL